MTNEMLILNLQFTVFLHMNDNDKKSNLHSYLCKEIPLSSHMFSLWWKKSICLILMVLSVNFNTKNKES